MYGQGGQVLGVQLPNTGDSWVMTAAAIVTLVAGVAIVASTVAFIVAKKTHKAKA
jgi:LPXTG-motif cell wall-anchored protein